MKSQDYGLDRSMVLGYGQDDRVYAYTSLMALLDIDKTKYTCILLVDKEEIGCCNRNAFKILENTVAKTMDRAGEYSELKLRRALANSKMLSQMLSSYDPLSISYGKNNSAYFEKVLY